MLNAKIEGVLFNLIKLFIPAKYQSKLEIVAIPITVGTKYALILSASLAIGAFEPWASSTSLIIFDRVVSLPIASVLKVKLPFLLILPPITFELIVFSTGMLSHRSPHRKMAFFEIDILAWT